MRSLFFVWLSLSGWVVACGAGDRPSAPAPTSGGAGSHGGVLINGGARTTGDAGAASGDPAGGELSVAGETSAAGSTGVGGTADSAGLGGEPNVPEPICDPLGSFGESQFQGIADASKVQLLSITLDEKSLAYVVGEAEAAELFVADRPSSDDAFGTGIAVTLPDGYDFASGATLSADGLRLLLVKADQSGFGQLSRTLAGEPFAGDVDEAPFLGLNSLKITTGSSLGWPLLSADDKTLYFVSYQTDSHVVEAHRKGAGAFDYGTVIDPFTLGGDAGAFKLLTGIAADQRAIFFFDQRTGHSAALFRSRPEAPFYTGVDFGERRGLGPNADCTRVYSSTADGLVRQSRD